MENVFAYSYENNIYINLTNRCSNNCTFCLRNSGDGIGGNYLWIDKEPTAAQVMEQIVKMNYLTAKEIVFCGYGEPTYRINEIVEIGKWFKSQGKSVRLDTNGQGNLINGYNIVPKLKNAITKVNVSLNNSNAKDYQLACQSIFGENAFKELASFALKCKSAGIETTMSVVDVIGAEEIEKCKRITEKLGVTLRVRTFIENNK